MKQHLQPPDALNPRHFHSQAVLDAYNAAVAAYLAQQQAAEYAHSKDKKRNKRFDRNEY
jgi:hypothetical protein